MIFKKIIIINFKKQMGSHSYLVNLNDIVIGNNDGTIVIPSQPEVKKGGQLNATINGTKTTIQEGVKINNVNGVVTQAPTHNANGVVTQSPTHPKEAHFSAVRNDGVCIDYLVTGT